MERVGWSSKRYQAILNHYFVQLSASLDFSVEIQTSEQDNHVIAERNSVMQHSILSKTQELNQVGLKQFQQHQ